MITILGDYFEPSLTLKQETLTLHFSPSNLPLKKRWENNEVSADFIAEYVKNFWIGHFETEECHCIEDEEYSIRLENLHNSVKYISNELFENAMKFSYWEDPSRNKEDHTKDTEYNIEENTSAGVIISLSEDRLVFYICHITTNNQAYKYLKFINTLLDSDVEKLYYETMKNSYKEKNINNSGLGILSMICDYSAILGWKFRQITESLISTTTMVTLKV